ncbi:hypothetical protein BV25DRAFT_1829919 [Artomyces pyxidatus]|uniref:Uncharacterized protein n=1 Tax=Artomyces pyxidatus TaxID=48021 RepID=A0ACB8SRV1_9AGAM|nr:hypothetical protein BV25DRAFT_1829919 [Artomyces pyxidatus]
MFKRVERRRKRKEEEEELGLDEDMKAVMGLQDTDSSESHSGSDSDSSSSENEAATNGSETKKRKRSHSVEVKSDEDGSDGAGSMVGDGDEESYSSDREEGQPHVSIASALRDPIHVVVRDSEVRGCAVCPGKSLKNAVMIKVHEGSKAHQRRFKRVQELALAVDPDDDIQILLLKIEQEGKPKPTPSTPESRRAEKRKAKQAAVKAKREKLKELKAKAIALHKAKQLASKQEGENTSAAHDDDQSNSPKAEDPKHQGNDDGEQRAQKRRKITLDGTRPAKLKHSQPRYFDESKPGKQKGGSRGNHKPSQSDNSRKTKAKREKDGRRAESALQIFD